MATRVFDILDPALAIEPTLRYPEKNALGKTATEGKAATIAIGSDATTSAKVKARAELPKTPKTNGAATPVGTAAAGCATDESTKPQQKLLSITLVDEKAVPIQAVDRKQTVSLVIASENMTGENLAVEFSEELGLPKINGTTVSPDQYIEIPIAGNLCHVKLDMVPTIMIHESLAANGRTRPGVITQPGLASTEDVQYVYAANDGMYHLIKHGGQDEWKVAHPAKWKTCHLEDGFVKQAWLVAAFSAAATAEKSAKPAPAVYELKGPVQEIVDAHNQAISDEILKLDKENARDIALLQSEKDHLKELKPLERAARSAVSAALNTAIGARKQTIATRKEDLYTDEECRSSVRTIDALLEELGKPSEEKERATIRSAYATELDRLTKGLTRKDIILTRGVHKVGWFEKDGDEKTSLIRVTQGSAHKEGSLYSELVFEHAPLSMKMYVNSPRVFMKPYAFGRLLRALALTRSQDVVTNGSVGEDGTGAPSISHYNGNGIDLKYLRKDFQPAGIAKGIRPVTVGMSKAERGTKYDDESFLDIPRQNGFNTTLKECGFTTLISYRYDPKIARDPDWVTKHDAISAELGEAELKLKLAEAELKLIGVAVPVMLSANVMDASEKLKKGSEVKQLQQKVGELKKKKEETEKPVLLDAVTKSDGNHKHHLHLNDEKETDD
jgi:hypothetical protein